MKAELGVDVVLERGSGGVFKVMVDGDVVAQKSFDGFPEPDAIVAAVRARLSVP